MGDIYVHVRMKECCRNTLKDLDQRKSKAKARTGLLATPSLVESLGEKPIDEARKALPAGGTQGAAGPGSELEQLTQAACEKVCTKHAEEHEGKGEMEEGAFWRQMALAVRGKPVASDAFGGSTNPGAINSGSGAVTGEEIAEAATKKRKEYKEKGVTYSQEEPFYPASTHSDCSHFVHDVLTSAGAKVPYTTTAAMGKSKHFEEVSSPEPGDVIWQPGHMGIYTGVDSNGHPLGEQMGEHGAAQGQWGPGGWFEGGGQTKYYRPIGK